MKVCFLVEKMVNPNLSVEGKWRKSWFLKWDRCCQGSGDGDGGNGFLFGQEVSENVVLRWSFSGVFVGR